MRLLAAFDGVLLFDFADLGRRDLADLPLALEWRFIASPVQDDIVAGRWSALEVVYWRSGHLLPPRIFRGQGSAANPRGP